MLGAFLRGLFVRDEALYVRSFTPSCVVPTTLYVRGDDVPDDSSASAAKPLDAHAQDQIREQEIAKMSRDDAAIEARERRIAIERGRMRVMPYRRRA